MEPDSSNLSTEAVSPHFPPPKRTLPPSNGQPGKKKPALMQRPQSSIIDVTNFSFARPANQPKGFTLNPLPRLPAPRHASFNQVGGVESQNHPARREKEVSSKSIANPAQPSLEQYLAERTACPQPKDPQQTSKIAHKDSNLSSGDGMRPDNSKNANSAKGQEVINLEAEIDPALTTQAVANSSIPATIPRDTAFRPTQDRDRHASTVQNPPLPQATARQKDNLRVFKPRRENRKSALTRQQRSISSNKSDLHQLTEDTLFEMLIGRIRQREENEIAAANIQRQMENQILELKDENRDLHQRLETGYLNLQKNNAELKKHQARLEDWKLKIRKFKQVVDELGHDHDALKEDNERFKATSSSLEKEKTELFQAIDDAKLQIARAEGRADEQHKEMAEKVQRIALLQQALTAAQDQDECTKAELIAERNRSTTLESYIQNYAQTQAKQLGLIIDDQTKLMQDLNAGLESIATNATTFKDDILSATMAVFDQCRTSIETLGEKCSDEKLSVQEFTVSTRGAISLINNLATKLAESIETSNRVNAGVSKSVQDSLHSIESHLSADSQLFQQLGECHTSYGWLKGKLGAIEPTLEDLNVSVKTMLNSENNLARQFGDFGKKLEEAQMPKGNPKLDKQLADKFSENMQLHLDLQKMVSKMVSEVDIRKQLASERDATIQNLQQSLEDARERCRAVETRNQGLEIEKTALKGEIGLRDQRIRHELTTEHTSSQTQMQAQYEQQLRVLKAEKVELEKGAELVMTQLSGVQSALVEAKRSVDDQRAQRESLTQETDQRIEQLTQSCSEHMARVIAQTMEIQKYQQAEATSCMERNGLQEQLRQAQERIHELEQTFIAPSVEEGPRVPPGNIVPFSALESQLSPLRATSPYGDPADFAMLFMLDELLLATPHHKVKENNESPGHQEEATAEESKKPLEVADPAKVFDISPDMEPPHTRANTKRKAVNFAPCRTESTGSQRMESLNTRVPSTEVQSSTQAENATEEGPAKVTKHINKWTYSRVHASGIEVQQEESTSAPTRATRRPQRASPKGLVSISSASEAAGRSSTRGRGKWRSRGDRYNARFSQEG